MTQADRVAVALRTIAPAGNLATEDVPLINALGANWERRLKAAAPSTPLGAPPWTVAARKLIGLKEVPGPRHNPTILAFWKLGAGWLKTDEDPWCGGFMAWCMKEAGVAYPKLYPRAADWATWGVPCEAQVGAVGVKARVGGNHVFQIVGITADRTRFKALGGNQSNGVNIIDIKVSEATAIRWPVGVAQRRISLPVMPAGVIGASEA